MRNDDRDNVVDLVRAGPLPAHTIGTLVRVDGEGRPHVSHPWHAGELVARTTVAMDRSDALHGRPVLIGFVDADPARPVVTGLLADAVDDECFDRLRDLDAGERLHGRRLEFDASEHVSIRCGRSQILMDRFGKIVIKGCDILTRASSKNRIKGGSISLN